MFKLLIHWALSSLILMGIAQLLPGIVVADFMVACIAMLVLSVVNMTIRPVLAFFTFPITFLTLGLFAFVLNALMFGLAAWLVPGFDVTHPLSAVIGSMLLAILTSLADGVQRLVFR